MDFLKPYGAVPSSRQMEHYRIGKKAFFHFGVNTFTDLEWGEGTENESVFNPSACDCRQWIRKIKEAGFGLAILTAKHHDGFCLWDSKYTQHTVKNSPYGKDIMREFTDACAEYGVKAGVYISPWDRNAPYWGSDKYSDFFNSQLTELLSNYGKIYEVWWDGAGSTETKYDWAMWANTVRTLQKDAVIFGSLGATPYVEMRWVGNEGGFAGNPCFATINSHALEVEHTPTLNHGEADGERFIIAEVDTSTRPGWFFHADQEDAVKSVQKLTKLWFDSVGSNALMLLNFPPNRDGVLPEKDINNALAAHKIITDVLADDLTKGAVITCDTESEEGYNAENILRDDDTFFAPKSKNVTLTLKLDSEKKFNMFTIGEMIELGHRVRGFRVEADTKDGVKALFDGKCIGYNWAEFCDTVVTDTVRVVIYDSVAIPLIRRFTLNYIDESIFEEELRVKNKTNIAKRVIFVDDNTVEVEFGGMFPFNTVVFTGMGIYKHTIEVFDGARYNEVYENTAPYKEQVVTLPKTYTDSYKIRFWSKHKLNKDKFTIKVYEI